MASIIANPPGIPVTITVDPSTAGTTNITSIETTGSFSVPAGCYWVRIGNKGFIQDGDLETQATVNSVSWSVGHEELFEATYDQVTKILKKLPAFTGNGNGSRVFISYSN
jgi:hypothetical protein